MTITMFDSINTGELPSGSGYAYAGYVDGDWPDYTAIKEKFPSASVLSIAVSVDGIADCLDVEAGDATPPEAVTWLSGRLAAGAVKPCIYASTDTMTRFIATMGVPRSSVRLWTAHYGLGEHICGPDTCKQLSIPADGTQWTDQALGRDLDQSVLLDDFFGAEPPPAPVVSTWQVTMMDSLPALQQGATGITVRRIQGLCQAALPNEPIVMDGNFGSITEAAIKQIQTQHHVTADGIVGPVTWQVLVTGSS